MANKLIFTLTAMMFFLLPWYYQSSGKLQPVDIAIVLLVLTFFRLRLPNLSFLYHYAKIYKLFLILSTYTIITLLLNYIVNINDETLILIEWNIYYLIQVTVFLLIYTYFYHILSPKKSYSLILACLFISFIIPLACIFKLESFTSRLYLSFNNANQLGFFALVNMSLFFYITMLAKEQNVRLNRLISFLIINFNIIFLYLSASRACYPIAILYIISYTLLFKPKLRSYEFFLFAFLMIALSIFAIFGISYTLYLHMLQTRLAQFPLTYNGLMTDIYYRVARGLNYNCENIWYFLFGNGTFSNEIRGTLEFHNNFTAIFSQIGFLGLIFYIYMNFIIIKELYRKGIVYIIPYLCYMSYSMFHYSYRTRFNWLLLAMIIFIIFNNDVINFRRINSGKR